MRWILGVDERGGAPGVLAVARWLAAGHPGGGAPPLVPVRVLDAEHLRHVLRLRHLAEVLADEQRCLEASLRVLPPGSCAPPVVIQERTVAGGLAAARDRHGAAGVIVGRTSERRGGRLLRLGGTTRSLLQRPTAPILVVPPGLGARGPGAGPVVAVSSLSPGAAQACVLARALADEAGRALTIVHVAAERRARGARRAPPGTPGPFSGPERALAGWLARHAVWPEQIAVLFGELPPTVLGYAEARRSVLVVVEAGAEPGLRGAVGPRPWRRLASHAAVPVLIVPAAPASAAAERPAARTLSPPVGISTTPGV